MSIPIPYRPGYNIWNGCGVNLGEGISQFLDWLKKEKNIEPDTIRMPARAFESFVRSEMKLSPWLLYESKKLMFNSAWGRIELVAAKTPDNKLLFLRQGVIVGVGEEFNF